MTNPPINLLFIDLSHFDSALDYGKVKAAGIVGVVYKATQGSGMQDSTYYLQRALALSAGLLWGGYHFGDSSDTETQVHNFVNYAKTEPGELFCLDFEDNGRRTMGVSQAQAWVSGVEKALGRPNRCVLYSGNLIKENITPANQIFWGARRLWLAEYSYQYRCPGPWAKPWAWQYTDGTVGPHPHTVPGCPAHIDCNSYEGTPAELAEDWA